MTTTQVTLVQIDNYGPWTVTPEPRREMDLQTLQSRLFADIAEYLGHRDGYAFFTRFDNMITVTNGIGGDAANDGESGYIDIDGRLFTSRVWVLLSAVYKSLLADRRQTPPKPQP